MDSRRGEKRGDVITADNSLRAKRGKVSARGEKGEQKNRRERKGEEICVNKKKKKGKT